MHTTLDFNAIFLCLEKIAKIWEEDNLVHFSSNITCIKTVFFFPFYLQIWTCDAEKTLLDSSVIPHPKSRPLWNNEINKKSAGAMQIVQNRASALETRSVTDEVWKRAPPQTGTTNVFFLIHTHNYI